MATKGQVAPGNIDLSRRPVVHNRDGSISTVRSITIEEDGRFVLIPTVSDDGRVLSDSDAIAEYHRSHRHLGIFQSESAADSAAQKIHKDQEKRYSVAKQKSLDKMSLNELQDVMADAQLRHDMVRYKQAEDMFHAKRASGTKPKSSSARQQSKDKSGNVNVPPDRPGQPGAPSQAGGFAGANAQQQQPLDASGQFAGTGVSPSELASGWQRARIIADPPKNKPPDTSWYDPVQGVQIEYSTVGNELARFDRALNTSEISDIQQQMWQAGFYGAYNPTSGRLPFVTGQKDAKTRAAYIEALEEAAQQGVSVGTLLADRAASNVGQGGTSGAAGPVNVIQHASSEDVATGAMSGWQKTLGRGPTKTELDAFRAGYAARETAAQPDTSGGGTFTTTDAGNIANVAAGQAQTQNPTEAEGYTRIQAFDMMLKAIGVQ